MSASRRALSMSGASSSPAVAIAPSSTPGAWSSAGSARKGPWKAWQPASTQASKTWKDATPTACTSRPAARKGRTRPPTAIGYMSDMSSRTIPTSGRCESAAGEGGSTAAKA